VTLTPIERAALLDAYRNGHAEVLSAIDGITDEELDAHPLDGEWSVREIVHHLADSEMTSAIRLRRLIVEDNPRIDGYDEAAFALRLFYDVRAIGPSLDAMAAARATTADIVARLTEAQWGRAGTHSESGPYGMETWLAVYARHGQDHADQIRRVRAAMGQGPGTR
jgi:hypothetical protein